MGKSKTTWLSKEELIFDQMETYHRERVDHIVAGKLPTKLREDGRLVAHLIPETAVPPRSRFSGSDLKRHGEVLSPLGKQNGQSRFNADGFLLFDVGRDGTRAYTQLHRDGRIEAALSEIVHNDEHRIKVLRDTMIERALIDLVAGYLKFCDGIGLKPPLWLFVALLGCGGVRIKPNDFVGTGDNAIDRDVVHLPEIEIPRLSLDPGAFLRPTFDAIWNAAGFERSLNYDECGNRKERSR